MIEKDKYLKSHFEYHKPTGNQAERYKRINDAARSLAVIIFDNVPESAERTLALRDLEMVRMRSNQAIVVNENPSEE